MKRNNHLSNFKILEINQYLYRSGYETKNLSLEQSINFYNAIKLSDKIAYTILFILIVISSIVTGKIYNYLNDSFNIINYQDSWIIFAFILIPIWVVIGKFIDYFHKLYLQSLLDKYKINILEDKIAKLEYKEEEPLSPKVEEEIRKIRNLGKAK